MDQLKILERKLERAILARKQAEQILEEKALELYNTNQELIGFNDSLEQQINDRTTQLKESESKYRLIVENATEIIFNMNEKGFFTYVNNVAEKLLGYSEQEIIGSHFSDYIPEDHKNEVFNFYLKVRDDSQEETYLQFPVKAKNGSIHWIGQSVKLIKEGNEKKFFAIAREITQLIESERKLVKAREVAEKAQKAESLFLANMSHEIRTPLNAIVGMSHLLGDTGISKDQQEMIEILQSSATVLQELITDILDLSKIDAGKLEQNIKEIDLRSIITKITRTFQVKLDNKPVHVESEIKGDFATYLLGDGGMINQIMINLVGNSTKFTKDGFIHIRLSELEKIGNKRKVRFEVEDTGIGIAQEKIDLIFKEFKQASSEIKDSYGGTGLGLAITKKLIGLQGGKIHVESEVGKGTKMYFDLELEDTKKAILSKKEYELKAIEFSSKNDPVLVVEDNPLNQKYISSLLKKWNLKYIIADNGQIAADLCNQYKFGIIFMDLQMPVMNGFESTEVIRKSGLNTESTIIALTASTLLTKKNKALDNGMTDFLSKPFNPKQLHSILSTYLETYEANLEVSKQAEIGQLDQTLDTVYLTEVYQDDYDYMADMFDTFLKITPDEFSKLHDALDVADVDQVGAIAHKIKPTFQMVGLPQLSERMSLLEKQAKASEDIHKLRQLESSIYKEYIELKPVLIKQLENLNSWNNLLVKS